MSGIALLRCGDVPESLADGEGRGRRNRLSYGSPVRYEIHVTPAARRRLQSLTARDRRIVVDAVRKRLELEPDRPARNRKLLAAGGVAPWELRAGRLRVYYEVEARPQRRVVVLAIGIKVRNEVFLAGKRIQLEED
jgi:mRNA-degrading endonuclease RelE of RelBE toxin-antitoxin system